MRADRFAFGSERVDERLGFVPWQTRDVLEVSAILNQRARSTQTSAKL